MRGLGMAAKWCSMVGWREALMIPQYINDFELKSNTLSFVPGVDYVIRSSTTPTSLTFLYMLRYC